MIDLETELIEKISNRCKKLRENSTYRQDDIADKASISRIENCKRDKSGNFITDYVLERYSNLFNTPKQEIIFGKENEIEELLEELFSDLFRLIMRRNLDKDMSCYNEGRYNDLDVEIQKSVIKLASSFAEYNLQRYNFINCKDENMSFTIKKFDGCCFVDGEYVNIKRLCSSESINEETVIDWFSMEEKLWLICKDKIIHSFKANVIDNLFDDFIYSSINHKVDNWIKNQFIQVIVPDIVDKLKSNSIFKIGYMVENLIDEFLNEDITKSFQKTVPLQTKTPKLNRMITDNTGTFCNLSEEEKLERTKLNEEAFKLLVNENTTYLTTEKKEKLEQYDVSLKEIPEVKQTIEVDIDTIIRQAIFSKNFKNKNIPGCLTNNSQITYRLQEHLNEKIKETIDVLIALQNNLLELVTDEELIKFSK